MFFTQCVVPLSEIFKLLESRLYTDTSFHPFHSAGLFLYPRENGDPLNQPLISLQIQKQPLELFYKKTVLKHFAIFTGKHLYWSLFLIKLEAFPYLQVSDVLQKGLQLYQNRFQHRYFPVNIVIFLTTPTLKIFCERLLLQIRQLFPGFVCS